MAKPVLVVEDEKLMREALRDWLVNSGFEVATAEDGEQALEMISHEDFGVVVLDLKLPGKDGVQVLKEAIACRPTFKAIIITAYPSVETAVEAMKAGAVDYLTKPFAPEALERLIEEAFEVPAAKVEVEPEVTIEEAPEIVTMAAEEIPAHLENGKELFKQRQFAQAVEEFEAVKRAAPGNIEARIWVRKAKVVLAEEAVGEAAVGEEARPKYCVWMTMRMVSYRLCTHDYDCLTCEFDQTMQEKMAQESPEVTEAMERLKALPGSQRMCRYVVRGDISRRLCTSLYQCASCEFGQMMEDDFQQKLAERQAELVARQAALRNKEQSWWWRYWD